jgi:hypothetical protein
MQVGTVLREAQGGQAFANLARAFHLPSEKVEAAVATMVRDLTDRIERCLRPRRTLAALVELLGNGGYEQVLDTPTLLAAPHTQVIGNDALNAIADRDENERMVQRAADAAGVSEMIAEYLLPAVAAMLIGALAKETRPGLEAIMGRHAPESGEEPSSEGAAPHLPSVAGGVGFSGSTGGTLTVLPHEVAPHYLQLAEAVRKSDTAAGMKDPAVAVRGIIATALDVALGEPEWIRRLRSWGETMLNTLRRGSDRGA